MLCDQYYKTLKTQTLFNTGKDAFLKKYLAAVSPTSDPGVPASPDGRGGEVFGGIPGQRAGELGARF